MHFTMEVKSVRQCKKSAPGWQIVFENNTERKAVLRSMDQFIDTCLGGENTNDWLEMRKLLFCIFGRCQLTGKKSTHIAVTINEDEISNFIMFLMFWAGISNTRVESDTLHQNTEEVHNLMNYIGFLQGMISGLRGEPLDLEESVSEQ